MRETIEVRRHILRAKVEVRRGREEGPELLPSDGRIQREGQIDDHEQRLRPQPTAPQGCRRWCQGVSSIFAVAAAALALVAAGGTSISLVSRVQKNVTLSTHSFQNY